MKKNKKIFLSIILALGIVLALSGCSAFVKDKVENPVESIRIDNTTIYLAPSGDFSRVKLSPTILPNNATNKGLYYKIIDPEDASYLTVSSSGELKALGKEKEGSIKVRIISRQDASVYLDVYVYVVNADVIRLSFDVQTLKLQLGGESQKVHTKITPYYAEAGAQLGYEIIGDKNDPIAAVDEEGFVTPIKKGKTSLRVYTITDYGEESKEAFLSIDVGYAPLNYHIKIRDNNTSVLKQIYNNFEAFYVDLFKAENDLCDPNPEIRWYLDNSAIQQSSVQGAKNVWLDLKGITVGEHVIKAVLSSGEYTQELELPKLWVYQALESLTVIIRNPKETYEVNDTVEVVANHVSGQYPPDSYAWYLRDNSKPEQAPKLISETDNNTLYYEIREIGDYSIICSAIVKGVAVKDGVAHLSNIQLSEEGSDIYGVYVDGAKHEDAYVPHIKWDALAYDADITLQIRNDENHEYQKTLSSTDASYAHYFTRNGVYIPQDMFTLEQSFSFKISSSRYSFSDWYSYSANTIAPEHYRFLDSTVLDMNSYIVNMQELGMLLNYVSIFRPATLEDTITAGAYNIDIYIPFDYDSVAELHPHNNTASSTDPALQNAFALIDAAFNCYGDTGEFSMQYSMGDVGNIVMQLGFPALITEYETTDATVVDLPFIPHYSNSSRQNDTLPIDTNTYTLAVSTSNQLYYAASMGYRPVPVAGSSAEEIYNIARQVLKRIIDDGMSDAQKVHAIYDYLTTEVIYDYQLLNINSNGNAAIYDGIYLEGVFLHGKAVCDGIAKAFNLLAWMEGIVSKKVSGSVRSGLQDIGHAWNKVVVGGQWYINDATWGSVSVSGLGGAEVQTHRYLLTTDSAIASTHTTLGSYDDSHPESHILTTSQTINGEVSSYVSDDDTLIAAIHAMLDILPDGGEIWVELCVAPSYLVGVDGFIKSYLINNQIAVDCATIAVSTRYRAIRLTSRSNG